MAPQQRGEIVILKLSFLPYIHPQNPRITLKRRKQSPSGYTARVRHWFNRIISKEKSKIPPNIGVRYSEWNITSGDVDLFTIHGYHYEKILLVLGEEVIYWVYYLNLPMHKQVKGCGRLALKYCSCCLNNQYLKILETVKECAMKTGAGN